MRNGDYDLRNRHDLRDVRQAQRGDVAAFERLYRTHLPRVHRIARWILGTDDVDDAIQDVFVRVWNKLDTFGGRSTFETWLNTVATRVVLRYRDGLQRQSEREVRVDFESEDSKVSKPDLSLDIEAAVRALPERARVVFVLHEVQGFSHDEIAEFMSTSGTTSRTQLHRARELLRARLMGRLT